MTTKTQTEGLMAIWAGGQTYALYVVPPSVMQDCLSQYRLVTPQNRRYTVTVNLDCTTHCDCETFASRKDKIDSDGCVHCAALRNSGLLFMRWISK